MKIEKFTLEHYEELVDMYYEFTKEVYPDRKIGFKYSFYLAISEWINKKHDIVLAMNNDTVCGFSMCYVDEVDGLTEPMYRAEIAYVKPKYRRGRAAYMLYNNAYKYSKDIDMKIITLSRISNGTDKMVEDKFNLTKTYTMYEGV